jgi:hypothetical protein
MKVQEIKRFTERTPFRPFAVRLSNGARYEFRKERDLGVPKNQRILFYFGAKDWVMIDTENIVEVSDLSE